MAHLDSADPGADLPEFYAAMVRERPELDAAIRASLAGAQRLADDDAERKRQRAAEQAERRAELEEAGASWLIAGPVPVPKSVLRGRRLLAAGRARHVALRRPWRLPRTMPVRRRGEHRPAFRRRRATRTAPHGHDPGDGEPPAEPPPPAASPATLDEALARVLPRLSANRRRALVAGVLLERRS